MTAKETLRRLRESEAELAALEETLLRLSAEADRLSVAGEDAARSELCSLTEELSQRARALQNFRTKTTRRILAVAEPELRTLLLLYYADGCTWEQVGKQMNYSKSTVLRMHNAALQNFSLTAKVDTK